MKKIVLGIFGLALLAVGSVFTACTKDSTDTTPPVITLLGDNPMRVALNTHEFVNPGATATDEHDGTISNITTTISTTNPDLNHTGSYNITYTATDAAGNSSTAIRVVTIYNEAETMEGDYNVVDATKKLSYTDHVTASTIINNRISFGNFAAYPSCSVYANIIGGSIEVPNQLLLNIGVPPYVADRNFSGTGSIASATQFSINYTELTNGTSSTGTGTYTKIVK